MTRVCQCHMVRFGGKFESTSLGSVLKKWKTKFGREGVSEPVTSIEQILAHFLDSKKTSHVYRNENRLLRPQELAKIESMCELRLKRMPLQYIIGEWDFRDLTLKMSRPVFIPRPETEKLVDIVLNEIDSSTEPSSADDRVLELCCGTGAISLALLKARPKLKVLAVDKSEEACNLTLKNARRLNLSERLKVECLEIGTDAILPGESFGIIVSNPPYVPSEDMESLQPEIELYEDLDALDGGRDGTKVLHDILNLCSSTSLLSAGGKLFLEVDPSHPSLLMKRLREADDRLLKYSRTFLDFYGKERFVQIIKRA